MKRSKKLIALLAAASLLVTGACNGGSGRKSDDNSGGRDTQDTSAVTTTEDPNKEFETEASYEEYKHDEQNEEGAGKLYEKGKEAGTIRALCYYDFKNIAPENDILRLYAERFGGEVEMMPLCTSLDYLEKLGTYIAAGDSPDIVRYEWIMVPAGIIQNRYTQLDDWLDISSPVWSPMADIIEKFQYKGKHYYFPQTMQANYGMVYTTAAIDQMGAEDPMDLYFKGEWTWTEFEELLKKWMAVNSENYGITMSESFALHLSATAGVAAIEFDGSSIKNNLRSPEITKTMAFVENLAKQGYIHTEWRDPGEGFADNKLLFYVGPIEWMLNEAMKTNFNKNLDGEVRAVPYPKDPDNDKYNILGNCYGYLIPAGAKNVQGAVSWILAGRIYQTDPEVVKERRDELLYNGPNYFPKCTKCKHVFDSEHGEENETCPECGEPRKPKFKVTYDERQMQVLDDMVDPSKFDFLFDQHRGFGTDMTTTVISIFDDPCKGEDTYAHLLEENNNIIETTLNNYRAMIEAG